MQQTNSKSVIWEPLPGSQQWALSSPAHETLYYGTRGPGKTEIQLMFYKKNVGVGYGPYWRGAIFDFEYKNLDDLEVKSKKLFYKFGDGARYLSSSQDKKWVWPTGEELLFRTAKTVDDYWNYHGHELPFLGFNELTKYPNPEFYDAILSCNRSSFGPKDWPFHPLTKERIEIPPIPEVVFSTTNSKGPGRLWVKKRFVDPAISGKLIKTKRTVFNPQTGLEEEITTTQVGIFGSWKENKYLTAKYIAQLINACKDENTRKSWLEGDWNVIDGGAFNDLWKDSVHVLPRFKIPASWYIDRCFDWGSSKPFCVGWYAEANGEEAYIYHRDATGQLKKYSFCPPKGSIIKFYEWYGTDDTNTNKGIKLSAGMIAVRIKEIEERLLREGWITTVPHPGPADNQIRDVREDDVETIEKKMADKGITWKSSDKSGGSRRNGFLLFREMLEGSIEFITKKDIFNNEILDPTNPGIFFMNCCNYSVALIPNLERETKNGTPIDDVDTESEDHPYDELRYRVLSGNNRIATSLKFQWLG